MCLATCVNVLSTHLAKSPTYHTRLLLSAPLVLLLLVVVLLGVTTAVMKVV